MSDYRRLVAYIYLYNQGKRVKNVGFTKVESRNGECRIQIQIKGAWVAEGNACKFYIFYRKDGKMRGILLGEAVIRSGSAQMKLVTETENIMQSGLDLGQMAGLIILSEKDHLFATRWDDEAVSLEQLVFHETGQADEAARSEKTEKPVQETAGNSESAEQNRMTDKTKFERDVQMEHHAKSVRMTNADVADEPGSSQYMTSSQEPHCTQPESVIQVSDSMQEVPTADLPSDPAHAATDPSRLEAQALESLWEKLRKGRERLHPFGEQDGGEYIFLEPKDLLTFQDNGKYLVNNSFLLHGFYNYGHILLGTEAGDGMLILGVPGEFYIQEKLMASLFGFPEFRKTVDAYGNVENMGYWLRKMEE